MQALLSRWMINMKFDFCGFSSLIERKLVSLKYLWGCFTITIIGCCVRIYQLYLLYACVTTGVIMSHFRLAARMHSLVSGVSLYSVGSGFVDCKKMFFEPCFCYYCSLRCVQICSINVVNIPWHVKLCQLVLVQSTKVKLSVYSVNCLCCLQV
jgi:hypothetical protein